MNAKLKHTGLLFGSFNPPHNGHLAVASYMCDHEGLAEVWFVVTPQNPLKDAHGMAAAAHRLTMTQMAVSPYPKFRICDIEFTLPQPTYTINTLDALRRRYPRRCFYLLIGEDNRQQLPLWKDADRILAEYPLLVYPRNGYGTSADAPTGDNLHLTAAPCVDISSTAIRQALAAGTPVSHWLPAAVHKYIAAVSLYR